MVNENCPKYRATMSTSRVTDHELISIISGVEEHKCRVNIVDLFNLTPKEIAYKMGITVNQATKIACAFELSRRSTRRGEGVQIKSSSNAFAVICSRIAHLAHEEFWAIYLNRVNAVIKVAQITSGSATGTLVNIAKILRIGILEGAHAIIVAHNHPSGNLQPSQADLNITRQLVSAGKSLDIPVLDHLVVTNEGYKSFADEGWI